MKDLLARDAFVQALNNPQVKDKVHEATLWQALTTFVKL